MKKMEHQVVMEYEDGYFKIGMANAYTPGMLADEFWAITQNTWEMGPGLPIRRETDGTIVHGIITDWPELCAYLVLHEEVVPPVEILEDRGRGTLQERYPDPEVQGGKIALIAVKQMRAQKTPNDLDRM
jgi:hypothetical protein